MKNGIFQTIYSPLMWKVLGKDVMYVEIGDVWAEEIVKLSAGRENEEKFKELMKKTEVKHLFDGSLETHNFMLDVPKDFTPEDIQIMADIILGIAKDNLEDPFVSLDGNYQKSQVIISNDEEPELIGMNRTEGFSSAKIFMPIMESLVKPGRPNESMLD